MEQERYSTLVGEMGEVDVKYLENYRALLRYASRELNGNQTAAEDVLGDTYLRAKRNWHKFREKGSDKHIKSWFFKIVHNLVRDLERKSMRRAEEISLSECIESSQYPDNFWPHKDLEESMSKEMKRIVGGLPSNYVKPVTLYYLDGLSAKEGAEVLRISVPAFKGRLYRGIVDLRRTSSENGLELLLQELH